MQRVKLPREKQKKLIEKAKAKTGLSWAELALQFGLNPHYLCHELRNGECTLSFSTFKQLCAISEEECDSDVVGLVKSNWGQKKGGVTGGGGKPKRVKLLCEKSSDLAEIIGVILGDGHLDDSSESGQYAARICGGEDDWKYLESFVSPLFSRVLGQPLKSFRLKTARAVMFYVNDKNLVFTLEYYGLKPGNKKKQNVGIPSWIFENNSYLKSCIRGLFDTDGTVFPKSSNRSMPQLELTSKIKGIQETYRRGLLQLGFKPSKWSDTPSPKCGLYARREVDKFAKSIGFHNQKHAKRFESITGKKYLYMSE
ncbi:MAG: LAGLIDADG family homing endonuclease [Candidatus Bathyarchaeia archaeon]